MGKFARLRKISLDDMMAVRLKKIRRKQSDNPDLSISEFDDLIARKFGWTGWVASLDYYMK